MAIKPLMKNSTAKQLVNAINMLAASQGAQPDVTDWKQVQTAVASGYGPSYFPIGSQLIVNHSVYGARAFDVVAHNYLKPKGNPNAYTMTIMQHDLLPNIQFDAPEAFYYVDAELAAGTYNFTIAAYDKWVAGTYQFTLAQAVPAGGQLAISGAAGMAMTSLQVRAYANQTTTTVTESVAITSGSGGTSLGTFGVELNHAYRVSYGSNNYKESAARQFLNSTAAAGSVWTPQTKFDRPPAWQTSLAGYMAGFDQDFLAVVGKVVLPCSANDAYEAPDSTVTKGGKYTLNDEFYIASMREISGNDSNSVADDSVLLPYYEDASAGDRIKYRNGSVANWWLRTPYSWTAHNVLLVNTVGAVTQNNANNALGLAPACTIY